MDFTLNTIYRKAYVKSGYYFSDHLIGEGTKTLNKITLPGFVTVGDVLGFLSANRKGWAATNK